MAKKKGAKKGATGSWPKPDIAGAVRPAQTWFVDPVGEVKSGSRKRKREEVVSKDEAPTSRADKARKKLNIKGSLHEHAKIQRMAERIKTDAGKVLEEKKATADLWAGPSEPELNRPENEWVAWSGSTTVPVNYKRKSKRKPEPSPVPHVVVAHRGASIRPIEADRKELVRIATGKEMERLDAKDALENARKRNVPEKEEEEESDEEESDEEDSDEELPEHRKVVVNKLTKTQRNKQQRQAEREGATASAKVAKGKAKQLNRMGEFIKELKGEETAVIKGKKQALERKADVALQYPKRLSKHRLDEARPEVKLEDEVPKHLRTLEVEGNPFRERYQSLQKRNIVEPRAVQRKKKNRYGEKVRHIVNKNGTTLNGMKDW